MCEIQWDKIFSYYNSIKKLYIESEETDPELKTNLQPLNEFRAALDHLMQIVASEKLENWQCNNLASQGEKLLSHLRRAFYDVSDFLAISYRNKIIDTLQIYSTDVINGALPDYYSKIRPTLETLSQQIASLRTDKGFNKSNEEKHITTYLKIIEDLRSNYIKVLQATPSLEELHKKEQETREKEDQIKKKDKKHNIVLQVGVGVATIVVAVVIAVIGWVV